MIKLIVSVFLFPVLSFAGAINGGGGKSVVCRDTNHSIVSAETLDLYEGKTVYGIDMPEQKGSLDDIVARVKLRLNATMNQPDFQLYPLIAHVQSVFHLTNDGVIIKPVDDAAEIALPSSCAIEQLANYVDEDLLIVQREIWNALSNTNKAALIFHEAIYRYERYEGATNSRRTRKIVSALFGDTKFEQVSLGVPANAKYCAAYRDGAISYEFFYYPTQNDMTKLQFIRMNGLTIFSRKTAVIPMSMPWWDYYREHLNCHTDKYCNIAGGDTTSNFENSGFITIGRELMPNDQLRFYILDDSGMNFLSCQMGGPHE